MSTKTPLTVFFLLFLITSIFFRRYPSYIYIIKAWILYVQYSLRFDLSYPLVIELDTEF